MKTYDVPSIAPPYSRYAHAAEVEGPVRLLEISGQVGVEPDGNLLEGFEAQAEQTWRNIEAVLADAGMTVANLVKVTMLLTDRADLAASRAIRDAALGDHEVACTLFVVAGLASPDWHIEIEAVAAAPVEA